MDKRNIYKFPKKFRGNWILQPLETTSADSNSVEPGQEFFSLSIAKKYTLFAQTVRQEVLPRKSNKILYDSLHGHVDSASSYLVHAEYIYDIDENRLLGPGHRYNVRNDTIKILYDDTICVDLGQNALLRKLNKDFYALNIWYPLVGEESAW